MKTLLLILITAVSSYSQVVITNQGYLINKEDLSTLDYWARKGQKCQENVDANMLLLEQIRHANLASDSITMQLQRNVYSLKKDLQEYENSMSKCLQKTEELTSALKLEKAEKKQLKKTNLFLKIVIIVSSGFGAALLIK